MTPPSISTNTPAAIQERIRTGQVSSSTVWLVLGMRTILFAVFQAIIALLFFLERATRRLGIICRLVAYHRYPHQPVHFAGNPACYAP